MARISEANRHAEAMEHINSRKMIKEAETASQRALREGKLKLKLCELELRERELGTGASTYHHVSVSVGSGIPNGSLADRSL